MAQVKVSELSGAALNWAVAKCEDRLWLAYDNALNNDCPIPPRPSEYLRGNFFNPEEFRPSTDWSQGGPIIEREEIAPYRWACEEHRDPSIRWKAEYPKLGIYAKGSTMLIAAMRCYVSSKMGDVVEIPDELIGG